MTSRLVLDNDRVGLWMHRQGAGEYRTGSQCIGLERDGEMVAGVLYDYCNRASIYTHIAIDGPISRRWLHTIFHYPFVQLGCNVIIALVAEDNTASVRLVARMGFTLNTHIPDASPAGDLLIYTMRHDECRFLREDTYGKA